MLQILVVEDEHSISNLIKVNLTRAGYACDCAYDGLAAVDMLDMPSITICVFLTLTNSFKLFDQNLALTGGDPNHMTEMLALNIYQTFYARAGAQWKGLGQAKAVLFCLLVIVISVLQLRATRKREVQQ